MIKKTIRFFKRKRILKKALICIVALLLVSFIFRSPLVRLVVYSKVKTFNEKHHAELHIGKLSMTGFFGLKITDFFLKPENGDTLIKASEIGADLKFTSLLVGKLSVKKLSLNDAFLTVIRKNGLNNYAFLSKRDTSGGNTEISGSEYKKQAERLLSMVFNYLPARITIKNLTLSSKTERLISSFHIRKMSIKKNEFALFILQKDNKERCDWIASGSIDKSNKEIHLKFIPAIPNTKVVIPFIEAKMGMFVAMDTLNLNFTPGKSNNEKLPVSCSFSVSGLKFKHKRISAEEVSMEKLLVNLNVNIGKDYIEIDSSSELGFNKLVMNPYARFTKSASKHLSLRLDKRDYPASDLFESLPEGLFTNFKGFQATGTLAYHFYFDVDLDNPDSIKLESDFRSKHFAIKSFGSSNLGRLNNSFEYTAFEKGEPVASFIVGPGNPNFIPLDRISHYLKDAVMTSEDAFFYQHRGFILESIKEAISKDIKDKRFARGGSTITMQLVKNVFLTKNKTIARKLEEALIVWLIEYCGLSTKERIYEVYLNIIEWGPGIYGAQAASRFYFNKSAQTLNLSESVFLASIIPRPKWFMYCFYPDGSLKDYESEAFTRITERMVKYNFIPAQDTVNFVPSIKLTGRAKDLLKKSDTINMDTLLIKARESVF